MQSSNKMYKNKKGRKQSTYKNLSSSSIVSDLSNPSENSSELDEDEEVVSIPDAIAEEDSEEGDLQGDIPSDNWDDYVSQRSNDSSFGGPSGGGKKKSSRKGKKKYGKRSNLGVLSSDEESLDGKSTKSGRSMKSSRSTRSTRSNKRSGKKDKKKKKKSKKEKDMDEVTESDDEEFLDEFEALQDEVLNLRRKLNMKDDDMEMTQLQMDLKRALNEANELKSEIDEYEEAVAEKDGLIKKLTEAVDCQLDKVEYLELKLQRAEEEFVKMEDEMREMEDEIDELRAGGGGAGGGAGGGGGGAAPNGAQSAELMEKERDLEERENDLLMKEQELLDREKTLVDREESIEIEEEKLSDQKDDLRMKELQFEEREREYLENNQITSGGLVSTYELEEKQEEINTLKRNLALKTGEVHELRGQLSRGGTSGSANSNALREENDRLKVRLANYEAHEKEMQQNRHEEIRNMQMGAEKQLQDLYEQNESLKRRVEALTLEQADIQHSDVHDQLRKKDEFAMRQQQELEQVYQENEELKEDLADTAQKLKKAELQVREFKGSANKKTKQKDETIDFMQGEMVRLTMENKEVQKDLQEKIREVEALHLKYANAEQNEETEMMRIQAFTEQIRVLDEENQKAQAKIKTVEDFYSNKLRDQEDTYSKQLKEREATIHEMQNSKGGGYARSRIQLSQAQGELRQANEKIEELEATIEDLRGQKDSKDTGAGRRAERPTYNNRANGTNKNSNGGLGVFAKKKQVESTKATKGLFGWGARPEQNESKYDQNNRINMVPHESPTMRERPTHMVPQNIPSGPIITGQSIEDELAAIEANAKKYKDNKQSDGSPDRSQSSFRIDMAGKLNASVDGSPADDDMSSKSSSSSSSSSSGGGMDIASRLEALRAKRNRAATVAGRSAR